MGIIIRQPGILTSVQDAGRFGAQRLGVSVTGAADIRAYGIANRLVGNFADEACLEATLAGLELEFTAANTIALTGGDMGALLNGKRIPMYQAVAAEAGDFLRLSERKSGCRAYIAFAGGLDVPVMFGSRSTHLRCGFGGFEGRKLKTGDTIAFLRPKPRRMIGTSVPVEHYQTDQILLRVVLGPQDDYFTEAGLDTFLSFTYTATQEMDRLGVRLEGPEIEHSREAGIISDGVAFGSIQVPANGQPIIMLADRQSTGGYSKIATVISVDIPLVAQAVPGTKIRFSQITMEEAQGLAVEQYHWMQALEDRTRYRAGRKKEPQELKVNANGKTYCVLMEEL